MGRRTPLSIEEKRKIRDKMLKDLKKKHQLERQNEKEKLKIRLEVLEKELVSYK